MPMNKPIDAELAQFQIDLLESVRQMKTGNPTRTTLVPLTSADARDKVGDAKVKFKDLQGIACNAQSKEYRDRSDRT